MTSKKTTEANKMWGGRFQSAPNDLMDAINVSIDVDKKMAFEDLEGTRAHVAMLLKQNIIPKEFEQPIFDGLKQIEQELQDGTFPFQRAFEDIHMNIEARLKDLIGTPAGSVHTARSRNDQVATDFRLWCRKSITEIIDSITSLQKAFVAKAEIYAATPMPGYTHLQTAQPVTFGHHCLAYVEMLSRDKGRFDDALKRLNECPLGAGALAGTPYPIDRFLTAEALGFERPMANSLDAVSARDFALEALAAASITAMHLSRFAEEIVIWMSAEFQFITLSDTFATGSSIMPQKKNPDAAELLRAKGGRITGAFIALLIVMKGVPLAYAKDMQEDKEQVFDALPQLILSLKVMTGLVEDLTPREEKMRAALERGYPTATDLADWCVEHLKIPFREAHHIAGKAVAEAEKRACTLQDLPLEVLQSIEPRITKDIYTVLTLEASLKRRKSYGGTAPENVLQQVSLWKKSLT